MHLTLSYKGPNYSYLYSMGIFFCSVRFENQKKQQNKYHMGVCVHFSCKRYFSIYVHKPMEKTKYDVWHRSTWKVKAGWEIDMQLQQLIHTTMDPFSFGCLDKLTPSHWLSRSSRQVFPQRSPLGLPRTQRAMLWAGGQSWRDMWRLTVTQRTLQGDCSN